MGSPAFTASPYLSKRSFGLKLSITQTALKVSLEWSEASWFLVILAQTRGVSGMLPSKRGFLNRWGFVSTLTFYPKRMTESLPKTSALSTLVNTKTDRVDGPWIVFEELIRYDSSTPAYLDPISAARYPLFFLFLMRIESPLRRRPSGLKVHGTALALCWTFDKVVLKLRVWPVLLSS